MTNLISFKVKIIGKVQGVWFRKHTLEKAIALDIHGFVQNEDDGSVFAEIEGTVNQVEKMCAWFHIGAPLSEVIEVIIEQQEVVGYKTFKIKR